MTFKQKCDAAVEITSNAGIARRSHSPPLWRQAWRLGIPLRPPHFVSFWPLAFGISLLTALIWGLAMGLVLWRFQSMSGSMVAAVSLVVGFAVGIAGALTRRRERARCKLPDWSAI